MRTHSIFPIPLKYEKKANGTAGNQFTEQFTVIATVPVETGTNGGL